MFALLLAVIVGTWNGNWFPSGRAEHRANDEVESATIRAAGKMLRAGIAQLDPTFKEDVILCVNEMRGPRVTSELARAIGITNLHVAIVSGYRRRDRYDMQQDAILTTLPVANGSWSVWKSRKGVFPPRGYAHALIVLEPAVTASVYCVHLKSNYGDMNGELRRINREKRRLPIEQVIEQERTKRGRTTRPVVIAGDFNCDPWRQEFAEDAIFADLGSAGYLDVIGLLSPAYRWTHPNRRYGNSALDHIVVRGFETVGLPITRDSEELSDHFALFVRLK